MTCTDHGRAVTQGEDQVEAISIQQADQGPVVDKVVLLLSLSVHALVCLSRFEDLARFRNMFKLTLLLNTNSPYCQKTIVIALFISIATHRLPHLLPQPFARRQRIAAKHSLGL